MRVVLSILCVVLIFSSQITLGDTSTFHDINYNFDQKKVDATVDSFHFLRSFVDYYFNLIAQNDNALHIVKKAGNYTGWCVGDAHAENFGILLQENGSALFTMNDMDDSGPCPVALDLLRLLVSSRLYMPNIDTQAMINSYLNGLNGKSVTFPNSIKSMNADAHNAGIQIEAKKLKGNTLKRKESMNEVDSTVKAQITNLLENQNQTEHLKVLDMVSTSKIGGGSGGLLRYEVLITNTKKQLIHLELKELTTPAIAAVATVSIPDQASRMKKALQIDQGSGYSHYYSVFNIQGKIMLLRPKFAGNLGVSLADSSDRENVEIINFESFILGRIHAGSVNVKEYGSALNEMNADKWEEDISAMTSFFNKKFNQLKK